MNLEQLFIIFGTIIIEFIFEIYLFYFLLMRKLKRKDNFLLRFEIGLVVLILISFLIAIFYYYFGQTVIGRVLVYTSLFGLSIGHLYLCYDESIWSILICSTLAYALQNLVYKIFLIIWTIGLWNNWFDWWGNLFNLYYRILYYSIFAISIFILYKFFVKKFSEKLSNCHLKYQLLFIALGVLLVTNILCSLEDVFFLNLKSGIENEFNNYVYYVIRQTGNMFSIVCCLLVVILISQRLEKDNLKQTVEYLEHTIRAAERQYEISRDTINLINIKCHDIKYKIEASLNKKSNSFADINEMIAIYDSKIETGNKLLDVLFTEKSLYCEQNNIKFSAMIDGDKLGFIEDGDLYCIFGNITDNALEAVSKIPEIDKRIINITVQVKDHMLIIQEDNYFHGKISFDNNGLPITSKDDKDYHGFGFKSIKLLVEKYNGIITAYTNNDVFHLNILFNLLEIKKLQNK